MGTHKHVCTLLKVHTLHTLEVYLSTVKTYCVVIKKCGYKHSLLQMFLINIKDGCGSHYGTASLHYYSQTFQKPP